MTVPISKHLSEIYSKYPQAIEGMIAELARLRAEESLIGETTDDTLTRTYKQAGYVEALKDVHNWFKKGI